MTTKTTTCACDVLRPCEVQHEILLCPLHAAAPAMAAALELALARFEWESGISRRQAAYLSDTVAAIRAVLAKAGAA